MKNLLIDVDSKIPNLSLMKISSHLKEGGEDVEILKLNKSAYPKRKHTTQIIDASEYDKVFASIIFTTNKDSIKIENNDNVLIGGTGYDLHKELPKDIDNQEPDYSIYPDNDTSFGFITRGCIRNCYFCFVPKKEGMIRKYREVSDIVRRKNVIFMDNNILSYNKHLDVFKEILDLDIKLTFNQGLDIRLLNDENADLLSRMNYDKEYIFAFDDIKSLPTMNKQVKLAKKYIKQDWRMKFYVYCDPKKPIIDIIKRVDWCRENKVLPYIMRDFSCYSSENANFYTDLASWCNQPGLFKNMPFETFINKRSKNLERIEKSLSIFNSCYN